MTLTRSLVASLFAVVTLSSCSAFKEAMTAHVDVVARAGSQELTVGRLSEMLASSDVPLRPDAARTLAQLWVNYHLLGYAGAHGDSLGTPADADAGMWSAFAQIKTRNYFDHISAEWGVVDPATLEQHYNDGALLAAAHILLAKQPIGLSDTANDEIRKEAEEIARTVTAESFARVAGERSDDPGSKDRGGNYGVFQRGQMVPEFDAGILSVPPGGITGVVETQFGYHIIRRSTWAEIQDEFAQAYEAVAVQHAESLYFDKLEKDANVQVRAGAPKVVKAIAEDVDAYREDKTVVATARSGNLSASRLAQWMAAFPPQSQMRAQVIQAPDSLIPVFVKNVMRNELLLREADAAGIGLDTEMTEEIRGSFFTGVASTMQQLNLLPSQLADSAADVGARERLAADRVDSYLNALLKNEGEFVPVPEQLVLVLRDRYESRIVPAAIDRALAEATKVRSAADSLSAAAGDASQIPVPAALPPESQP